MAWEATHLLSPIVLVLLASGSWAQGTELHSIVEGRSFSVSCWYGPIYQSKEKVWCQKTSAVICEILVSSLSTDAQQPKYSMWDYPQSHFFTVTMTTVTMRDSGLYICGIVENGRRIITLRNIHLAVSKASTPHMTWMTTALASATSPVIESPPDSWMWKVTIAGVAVAILLLLGLIALVVLYFRNARGRAQGVENECHHIYEDLSGQKEETTTQIFYQQILSNKDTETICYASLIHLNHVSHQDSISSGIQPYPKPSPDPLLSVEYASLSRNTLQSSKAAAIEVETSN